ncbi:MAG: hypothetical protein ACREI3_09385, partial [Nitrospirales bacterium]
MSSQHPQADSVSARPAPSSPPGITDPGDGQAGHGSEEVEPLDTPSDVLEVRLQDKTVVLVGTA